MIQAASEQVYPVTVDNLPLYRIRAFEAYPGLVHAIFTRQGGVSQAPFDSLNLGLSVGDKRPAVDQNFARACGVLGVRPEQTVSCHLVHSARVFTVTGAGRRVMGEGDGLITGAAGVYLAMRFGDCTPLLFYDPVRGAVGLAHAGWRGTMLNVAGAMVRAMAAELGSRPGDIIAVIGPAIGPCCYEVGPEVIDAARPSLSEPDTLFTRRNGRAGHAHFDMWAANRRQLAEAGAGLIINSGLCTACRTGEFFSHRAERGRTGRFGVMIGLDAGIDGQRE